MTIRAPYQGNRVRWIVVGLVVFGIGAFHVASTRSGHNWGGDFSLYIMHARNIVEGHEYGDTEFIYNPEYPQLSPKTYPPVFPVFLVPFYAAYGLDIDALKNAVIITSMAALAVLFIFASRRLAFPYAILAILLVGMNPYVWHFRHDIKPEFLFVLFLYLAVYFSDRLAGSQADDRSRLRWAAMMGVSAFLAYGSRTIGLLVVPCLILATILRTRRFAWPLIISMIFFGLPALTMNLTLHDEGSYGSMFYFSFDVIRRNAVDYADALSTLFDNGRNEWLTWAAYFTFAGFFTIGFVRRCREGLTAMEIFVPLYIAVMVSWPYYQVRFIVPLIPAFFYYALYGLNSLSPSSRHRGALVGSLAVLALMSSVYVSKYSVLDYGPFRTGVHLDESRLFFEFIERETPKDAIFVFSKPRVLGLFTRRQAIASHAPSDDHALWKFLEGAGADYLTLARWSPMDMGYLSPFVIRNRDRLRPVYQNDLLTILEIEK